MLEIGEPLPYSITRERARLPQSDRSQNIEFYSKLAGTEVVSSLA